MLYARRRRRAAAAAALENVMRPRVGKQRTKTNRLTKSGLIFRLELPSRLRTATPTLDQIRFV